MAALNSLVSKRKTRFLYFCFPEPRVGLEPFVWVRTLINILKYQAMQRDSSYTRFSMEIAIPKLNRFSFGHFDPAISFKLIHSFKLNLIMIYLLREFIYILINLIM